mmetsp:Transcript_107874/g.302070  ORF Transcript_107874/g.302070 Transcript_107874/m.302070 type:complete len:231 (-) Transcript_107874:1994-2686(-)
MDARATTKGKRARQRCRKPRRGQCATRGLIRPRRKQPWRILDETLRSHIDKRGRRPHWPSSSMPGNNTDAEPSASSLSLWGDLQVAMLPRPRPTPAPLMGEVTPSECMLESGDNSGGECCGVMAPAPHRGPSRFEEICATQSAKERTSSCTALISCRWSLNSNARPLNTRSAVCMDESPPPCWGTSAAANVFVGLLELGRFSDEATSSAAPPAAGCASFRFTLSDCEHHL